jgi:hypothetical protein
MGSELKCLLHGRKLNRPKYKLLVFCAENQGLAKIVPVDIEACMLLTQRPIETFHREFSGLLLDGAHSPHDHLCPNAFSSSILNRFQLNSSHILAGTRYPKLEWKLLEATRN